MTMRIKKLLSTLAVPALFGIAALPAAAQAAETPVVVPHAPTPRAIDPHPVSQSSWQASVSPNPDVAPPVVTPLPDAPEPVASTCPHNVCMKPDGGGGSTRGGGNNTGGSTGGGDQDLPADHGHPSPGHENDAELRPDPFVTLFLCPLYQGLFNHEVELAQGMVAAGVDPSEFTQGFVDTMAFYNQMTRLYCMNTRLDL
jgi:hypothetical protein